MQKYSRIITCATLLGLLTLPACAWFKRTVGHTGSAIQRGTAKAEHGLDKTGDKIGAGMDKTADKLDRVGEKVDQSAKKVGEKLTQ